jgi:hypothetical protein
MLDDFRARKAGLASLAVAGDPPTGGY